MNTVMAGTQAAAVWRGVPAEQIFAALGNRARLRIVEELMEGERCVCELVMAVGLAGPTVSRHLAVLREAGIIADRRVGVQIHYRLVLGCVGNFIRYLRDEAFRERVEAFLQSEFNLNEAN